MFMLVVILGMLYMVNPALTPLPSYVLISESKTWSEADTYCQSTIGSRLAYIDNAADNSEASIICGSNSCWTGYNDVSQEGVFKYSPNGETPSYTNWDVNEPNNSGNEDCVEIRSSGKWNDLPCSGSLYFLCDSPATSRGYIKGPTAVTFLEAYYYCRQQNSNLASITGDRDNEDANNVCNGGNCWVGFVDIGTENDWKWLDGTSVTYTKWHPGEPNNLGSEHCTHLYSNYKTWNDNDCLSAKFIPLCNPAGSYAANIDVFTNMDDDKHELIEKLENKIKTDINMKPNGIYFHNINVTMLVIFVIGITLALVFVILCANAFGNWIKSTKKRRLYSSLKQINTESEESATDAV